MKLKTLLDEKGIKQKWLAQKLGVSEVTVSSWCLGRSKPRDKHVERISILLETSIDKVTEP
ncbi:MAG: helix-turn-helix transcriptional regulator [Mariniphaga sp.]